MNRLRYAFGQTLLSILGIGILSCSDQSISAPGLTKAPNLRLATHPGLHSAHYGAKLHKGRFVVCTNEAAPISTATYSILPLDVLPKDEYVTSVTLAPGECALVFERKGKSKKGEPAPSILVTSDPAWDSWGASIVAITGTTSDYGDANCAPQSYVLSGYDGGIANFHYLGPARTHFTCTANPSAPYLAPYTGFFVQGQFKVCTALSSDVETATYSIAINAALPGDRYVTAVTVFRGTCKIVFETDRISPPAPSITVTSDPAAMSAGAIVFDGTSPPDPVFGGLIGEDFGFPCGGGGFTTPQSYVLGGLAGATVKLYYNGPGSFGTGCGAGGHGGTGTIDFSLN